MFTDATGSAFEDELRASLQAIRGSITDLMSSAGVDATAPQVVAREVKINRNLAWKLSKIVAADEPLATIEHIPGRAGVRILLEAFRKAGAPATATDRVRSAIDQFDRAVEVHTGDRATLELMVANLLPRHLRVERNEAARRLSYQGNSATWGIQARVRIGTMFLAPSPDDSSLVDVATLGGLVGYRRLRDGTRWPLLRVHSYRDDGTPSDTPHEPIDPAAAHAGAPLLEEFCTGPRPEIRSAEVPGGVQYELGEGPIGNRGLISTLFALSTRKFASCYRDEMNTRGEHAINWFTPVEAALSDMIVHRDLPFRMPPEVAVYGRLTSGSDASPAHRDSERIMVNEVIQDLGAGPPVLATPLVADYPRMAERVFERMGWSPNDFAAYRFVMRYPPIPSVAVMSFPLGERPGS